MSLEEELRQAEAQNDRLNAALEVEVGARRSLAESLAVAYVELEETRKKLMLARHQWTEAESEMIHLRVEVEELRHRANGWADIATSGLQWLRNVRDGLSTPQTAIENMEALIADLREGRWRAIPDPAIRAEDLVEALSDEPAAPQTEVQP